ncbi:hypothetical protein FIM08_01410 [SAR202 cluster bacterium AC-647-N09_OGT_505m]|nr:hypothetical protein [SAR202 cluster bacterium AC-647-N09_OGT_505m]
MIYSVAIIVTLGLLAGRTIRFIRMPAVTGYLLMGILIGPWMMGVLDYDTVDVLSHAFTNPILCVIAYMIAGNASLQNLIGLKKAILYISIAEAGMAFMLALLLITYIAPILMPELSLDFRSWLVMGIVIGSICMATAPAVSMAIVDELKVVGSLPTALLGVIALDNLYAIIGFLIATWVAIIIIEESVSTDAIGVVLEQLFSILGSVLLGVVLAYFMSFVGQISSRKHHRFFLVMGIILASSQVALTIGLFPILVNLVFGFTIVNLQTDDADYIGIIKPIQEPMFALFFSLAGAHMNLDMLRSAGILTMLIVLGRDAGKVIGSWLGAVLADTTVPIRKYLGFALMPKAGVTIGLTMLITEISQLDPISDIAVTAILASTLINELSAPPISRFVLARGAYTRD